jgi:TonB family protein
MIASLFLSALLAAPPELLPGDGPLLTPADYPAEARYLEQDGRVGVLLDIDAAGRISRCTVTETAGVPALDARTCELLPQRMRYRPATDGAGKPVPSRVATSVRWALGPREPAKVALGPEGESGVIARYQLAKGAITGCRQEIVGTPSPGIPDLCGNAAPDAQALAGLFGKGLASLDSFDARILMRPQTSEAVAAAAAKDARFAIRRLMTAADFSVAPSGKVLACAPVPEMLGQANGCTTYREGDLMFSPRPEAQGPLIIRLTIDFVGNPRP